MRLMNVPLEAAVGHILCHNQADAQGRKVFAKGDRVRSQDLARLRELGLASLRVAIIEPGDVHEDEAAQQLATAAGGAGLSATTAHSGRVNLRATVAGPLVVNKAALFALNELDGLTVATLRAHTLVQAGQPVATVKVIPFAVPAALLQQAAAIGQTTGGVLAVRPLCVRRVGVVLVGSDSARRRVEHGVFPAIADRVAALDATVCANRYVNPVEELIAEAIADVRAADAGLVIIAGDTSIMDRDDVTPRGIILAGGRIEHYGAPVEPGNLLLLAYADLAGGAALPILGAPGCVRSRKTNIVDLILPRLMAGERVRRRDIIALGHGGYM